GHIQVTSDIERNGNVVLVGVAIERVGVPQSLLRGREREHVLDFERNQAHWRNDVAEGSRSICSAKSRSTGKSKIRRELMSTRSASRTWPMSRVTSNDRPPSFRKSSSTPTTSTPRMRRQISHNVA